MSDTYEDDSLSAWQKAVAAHEDTASLRARRLSVKTSIGLVAAYFVLQLVVALPVGVGFGILGVDFQSNYGMGWVLLFTDIAILWHLYRRIADDHSEAAIIGVKKPEIAILNCLILVAVGYVSYMFISAAYVVAFDINLQSEVKSILQNEKDNYTVSYGIFLLTVIIGAPIVEELLFRGYLQTALAQKYGAISGVAISSIVFAAVHMDLAAFPTLFALSVILGALFLETKSVWPSILLHTVNNGLVVVFSFFL